MFGIGEEGEYGFVTRQERRQERLERKKKKMPQHGKGLAMIYKHAVQQRSRGRE